ncbi:dihydrofolate reductase [Microbacterium sp. bgisy203]|uniref:dihydrofolate reductase n=1 Tax=Microbacterium sp. bgisy203 TaxID=3413799 RepID=UPI003D74586F
MRLGLVWAEARGGVIGRGGGMPWHVPEDLAHFREVTTGAPVIMGRRTWESFPERFRPLPARRNIVVTANDAWADAGAERAASLDDALALAASGPAGSAPAPEAWVIGGARLLAEALPLADVLEVTELDLEVAGGDTFAPERPGWAVARIEPADGWAVSRTGVPYRFLTLIRP